MPRGADPIVDQGYIALDGQIPGGELAFASRLLQQWPTETRFAPDNHDGRSLLGSGGLECLELLVAWIVNPSLARSGTESRVSASSDQDTRTGAIAADHATHPSIDSAMANAHRKSQKRLPRARGRYNGGEAIC